jgi:ABC-type glycerol-3-phosphate transport system substrate-binding protein
MKRLLSGSLVLITVLSMMTVGTVQAVPRAQEKDKILFSTLSSPTEIIDHPWAKLVEEYNAANPNVEVEILAGATWDSLGTMILAGNPPDLISVPSSTPSATRRTPTTSSASLSNSAPNRKSAPTSNCSRRPESTG